MATKVKDRVIKCYLNYMGSFFAHWKKNSQAKVRGKKKMVMEEMSMENEKMQMEALEGEKQLRVHAEAVRTTKRKTVDKTFRKLFYRRLAVALGRWRDTIGLRQGQEARAELVIKRMRIRFLR